MNGLKLLAFGVGFRPPQTEKLKAMGVSPWRASLWFIFIGASILAHWTHHVSTDEGIVLTGGWQVAQGLMPYRDFFAIETPGTYYALGAAFRIFGAHYIVAKLLALFLFLFSAVGLYRIAKMFFESDFFAFLTIYIWLILTQYYVLINHNTFSIFFFIWAVYFLLRSRFLLAGIFGGLSFLFLQTKGVVFIALVMLLFIFYPPTFPKYTASRPRDRKDEWRLQILPAKFNTPWEGGGINSSKHGDWRNWTKRFFGNVALGFMAPLFLLLFFPLKTLYFFLVQFPLQNYLPFNQLTSAYFIIAFFLHGVLAFLLPIYLKPLTSHVSPKGANVWILFWSSVFLLLSSYTRPDTQHVLLNLPLFFILVFFLFGKLRIANSVFIRSAISAIVVFVLVYNFSHDITENTLNGFLRLENRYLKQIVALVRSNAQRNDSIYAGPFIPNYYFETQQKVPSRYSYMLTGYFPPEFIHELKRDIQKNKPTLALLFYDNVRQYDYSTGNAVDIFIGQNYKLIKEIYGISFYQLYGSRN